MFHYQDHDGLVVALDLLRLQLVYKYLGWGWGRYQARGNCHQLVPTKDNHHRILLTSAAWVNGPPCTCEIDSSPPVTSHPLWTSWGDWSLQKCGQQKHHCGCHTQGQGYTTPRALNGSWRMSPAAQLHSGSHTGSGLGRQSQLALPHRRTMLLPLTIHLVKCMRLCCGRITERQLCVPEREKKTQLCSHHHQARSMDAIEYYLSVVMIPVCSSHIHQQITNNVCLSFTFFFLTFCWFYLNQTSP